MKARTSAAFLLILVLLLCGCSKIVDSYSDFVIPEFDCFIRDIYEDKEEARYIQSGKLDFAKTKDTIIIPHIKDSGENMCTFLVYAYFVGELENVTIKSASLSMADGTVVWDINTLEKEIQQQPLEHAMEGYVFVVDAIEKAPEWFYDGNRLNLTMEYAVGEGVEKTEKHVNYEVMIETHKSILMPT